MLPITSSQITSTLSYILSCIGIYGYFLFGHFGSHYQTPFTGSVVLMLIYCTTMLVFQCVFLIKTFYMDETLEPNKDRVQDLVGPHFIISNVLTFFWCYFFAQELFIVSETILIVNLLNLFVLYFIHNTVALSSLSDWFTIHVPVTAMPLSWTLYAIFWNGACMFHSHNKSLPPRLLANGFIWVFFFVPMTLILLFRDYAVSFCTSYLMLALSLRQLWLKTFGLQWIFAAVISALDLLATIITAGGDTLFPDEPAAPDVEDQTPLLA